MSNELDIDAIIAKLLEAISLEMIVLSCLVYITVEMIKVKMIHLIDSKAFDDHNSKDNIFEESDTYVQEGWIMKRMRMYPTNANLDLIGERFTVKSGNVDHIYCQQIHKSILSHPIITVSVWQSTQYNNGNNHRCKDSYFTSLTVTRYCVKNDSSRELSISALVGNESILIEKQLDNKQSKLSTGFGLFS
ncbi:uncharacterized protein TRIADDRAFT_57338 [Trichoplax adhaerens]|uniref:Uncharacterized protein n=1 Tax=Trichoplax adhaerens TaxID=10228 RepID=B3RZ60_TRIAD|nr:predicted protein [Trichoplax adhaerens]EDV24146.1 predicted protein [Trichoplax adhaerens]|eukprot:XP_002113672.1 predicted protein [Trichoplax adhaerens]